MSSVTAFFLYLAHFMTSKNFILAHPKYLDILPGRINIWIDKYISLTVTVAERFKNR